jgi:hypothetical protein
LNQNTDVNKIKYCGSWIYCGRLNCIEIEGGRGGCLLQKKMHKEEVEMREKERRVER